MRAWRRIGLLAGLTGSGIAILGAAGADAAAPGCGTQGIASVSGATATCTYTAVGEDTFQVPAGVTTLHVIAVGAPGGSGGAPGGAGALVTAPSVVVTANSTLYIEVGAPGANGVDGSSCPGGLANANGGGAGGDGSCPLAGGGAGGGESDVRITPAASGGLTGGTGDPRLVVAGGGGGGAGRDGGPSDSGAVPYCDQYYCFISTPGSGFGDPDFSGAGGSAGNPMGGGGGFYCDATFCYEVNSAAGSAFGAGGAGGSGIDAVAPGGGGGGGGFSGGTGGEIAPGAPSATGGGAGSSFGPSGTTYANATGPASITISYTIPAASTTTTVTASPGSALQTQQVTFTATVTPAPDGGTLAFDDGTTTITGCGAQPVNNTTGVATCQTSTLALATHAITAVFGGDPRYQSSTSTPTLSETISPDTPASLASLTLQYVQSSAKYQGLSAAQQKLIMLLAQQATGALAKITPHLNPTQLAQLAAVYKQAVSALRLQGFLTAAQASTLEALADNTHP